jgi:hypothetical protein
MFKGVVYPAFRRPVNHSGFALFFAGFLLSIGNSISFRPAATFRGFLPFVGASMVRLFFRASIRSTTGEAIRGGDYSRRHFDDIFR